MMLILNFFILILFSHVHSIQFLMTGPKNSDTYGPYVVDWKYFESCANSDKTIANLSTSLIIDKNNMYKGTVNVTLPEAVRIVEIKVTIHSVKNNHKKLLWDYTIDRPCQTRLVAAALKTHVDIRSCVLRKGSHSVIVNFSESVYLFFGSSFFYGEYIARFTVMSRKQDVILCVVTDEVVSKKTNINKTGSQ